MENQNTQNNLSAGTVLYTWRALEYSHKERSKKWYWYAASILAVILIAAALMQNFLMGVTFLLLGVVGYIYTKREPREIEFSLKESGIDTGDAFYDYDDLKSFWIFYKNPPKDAYISVLSAKKLSLPIHLPLGEADPTEIRQILINFLPEQKHEEELATVLERWLDL